MSNIHRSEQLNYGLQIHVFIYFNVASYICKYITYQQIKVGNNIKSMLKLHY